MSIHGEILSFKRGVMKKEFSEFHVAREKRKTYFAPIRHAMN